MNTELIKLFGRVLSEQPLLNHQEVNRYAMQRGYIVHPDACTQSAMDFLRQQSINYNATFYKTWEDVQSKTRIELFIDQWLHYLTTYGTDYSLGNGYVPNSEPISQERAYQESDFKQFKFLLPITTDELAQKCITLLTSGAALKQQTMTACADFAIEVAADKIDIDSVSNREAQVYLCQKLGRLPKDKFALFRYIIFVTTRSTLVIKNRYLCHLISKSDCQFDFSTLSQEQNIALASIFYRYKPLFLAFKHHLVRQEHTWEEVKVLSENAPYINHLRRLAKTYHQPLEPQYWQTILARRTDLSDINNHLGQITLFKVVALLQTLKERLLEADTTNRLFIIRNQKTYLRNYSTKPTAELTAYWNELYTVLETYLIQQLRKKACVVKFPTDYTLALPTTEKSFVGNMPFGTRYHLQENNYIGIYWRNEWGTKDFDLSITDMNGRKIGWNSDYYNNRHGERQDIVFSGDMTNAQPEASEVLYIRKGIIDALIQVNRYNGQAGSQYKLYLGQENISKLKKNYMVDPASIRLTVDMESEENMEQTIGLIFQNDVTLMQLSTSDCHVSQSNPELLDCLRRKTMSFIDLKDILLRSGFRQPQLVVAEDGTMVEEKAEIDFTNLDRSTLLELLKTE